MAATSDERRKVAARLRDAAVDDGHVGMPYGKQGFQVTLRRIIGTSNPNRPTLYARLADLIDPTCVYEPTETLTRWDENDHEHETNEPDFYCETFACSRCGYEMIYGGEYGWFDTEPPYAPHFKFCPNCSARVLPLKLYDKVVSGDDD